MSNNANNFNIIITNLKNGVYIKASATVEAALVMPLYIYAVMAVTYMMQIYQIRLEVDAALYNALREQNKYNYLNYVQKEKQNDEIINEKDVNINDTIVGSLSLHSVLIKNLGSEYAKVPYNCHSSGTLPISFRYPLLSAARLPAIATMRLFSRTGISPSDRQSNASIRIIGHVTPTVRR